MSSPCGKEFEERKEFEEKVRKVLEEIEVKNLEHLSRAEAIMALGRLLSVKVREDSSVHEVTKEVRRALEMTIRNPLKENESSVIVLTIYTTPPFESQILNEAYRRLLERLLWETVKLVKVMNPMWKKKIVNLTIENIFNVARDARREYKDKIFRAIGAEKPEGESA